MAATSNSNHYHAFGIYDTLMIDITSNVKEYMENSTVPIAGELVNIDIRPTKSKELFSDSKIRTMIVEMHAIFSECHQNMKITGKLDNHESLYLSQKYRSVLRSAANLDDPNDQHMKDASLWAIYECMFLKSGETPIVLDLMNWAHECFLFCHVNAKIATDEYQNGVPLEQGNFWKAVVISLLCLRFDECSSFLRLLRNDSAARLFVLHLQQFEIEWLQDDTQFSKFTQWKESLEHMTSSKQFNSNKNIAFLARLLSGDDDIIGRCANVILTEWWHLMPFYVFVRYPNIPYNSLGPVAQECRDFFTKNETMEGQDDLDPFFAVFNMGDISVLQDLVANPWLSLHLVDTMFCYESYENPILKLRNNLLQNYGSALMINSDLWEIGVSYLLECDVNGKLRIESLISSFFIDDEDTAERLLKICTDNDLEEARTCVINTMTNYHLRRESWVSALTWALRIGQSKALESAVNTIVCKASEQDISNLTEVECLGELVNLSPSLAFLFNYYRYFSLLYNGDLVGSSNILIGLIGSCDVPVGFHSALFGQLACILKESRIPIEKEAIYDLLSFFKQYTIDRDAKKDEDILTLKQLLLMRLTQAIVA